jgi:RNA polymerase sigma-70 factor (ECF subfamily)
MVLAHLTSDLIERVNSHVTDENALLDRAKAYDPEALAELYDRYAPRMYAYIYRRVSDAALAEDLTSELFVRVLRAIRIKRAWRDSFLAWLYRIAHNLVVDVYRRQPPQVISLEDASAQAADDDPARETLEAMDRERLQGAIRRLTPDQQQVLALRYGEGLTARETARIVRKTTGAVEALQRRALAAIKRILAEKGAPDRRPSRAMSRAGMPPTRECKP